MTKRELQYLLSRLVPYVNGTKQKTALLTVVLMLALSHGPFDAPHIHVEPAPVEPSVAVEMYATGNTTSASVTGSWFPYPDKAR